MSDDQAENHPAIRADVDTLPDESKQRRAPFSLYDIFFWRDVPDWYNKAFLSAGMGFCILSARQYLNSHEIEVFLPPRAKILPQEMREGYERTQRFKLGLLKVGKETAMIAGVGTVLYGGAYYLGDYRGHHDWKNLGASGALAGFLSSLYFIRPPMVRPTVFGTAFGGALGALTGGLVQACGFPMWDESHGFEGWWLGEYINTKSKNPHKGKKEIG